MRKVDDGKRKEKKEKKKEEKNGVFSGHYVIASSLPPVRLRPNDDSWNAARSCQLVTSDRAQLLFKSKFFPKLNTFDLILVGT